RYLGYAPVGHSTFQKIRTIRPPWRGPIPPLRSWGLDLFDRIRWQLDRSDVVVDLEAAAALWLLGGGRHVRVVHRTHSFSGSDLRTRARRTRLRRAARRGDHFVVHTETARIALAAIVGDDAVARVALLGPTPKPRAPHGPGRVPKLLFVGDDRPEKGLDLL